MVDAQTKSGDGIFDEKFDDAFTELDRRLSRRENETDKNQTKNSAVGFEGKPSTSSPASLETSTSTSEELHIASLELSVPRAAEEPTSGGEEPTSSREEPTSSPEPTEPPPTTSPGPPHFRRHESHLKNVIILGPFDAGNHYFDQLWRKNFNATTLLPEVKKIWPHSLQTGKEKSIQELVIAQTGNLSGAALFIVVRNPISMLTSWIKAPYDLVHCVKRPMSRWDSNCPACLCPALSWEQQNRACQRQQTQPRLPATPARKKIPTRPPRASTSAKGVTTTSSNAVTTTSSHAADKAEVATAARRLSAEEEKEEEDIETTTKKPTTTTTKRVKTTAPRTTPKPAKKRGPPCVSTQFSSTLDIYNSYMRQYQGLLNDTRIGAVRLIPYEDLVRSPAKMLRELAGLVGLEILGDVVLVENAAKQHGKASGHTAALGRVESRAWLKNVSSQNRKAICHRLDPLALAGLKETAENRSISYLQDCISINITEVPKVLTSFANEPAPAPSRPARPSPKRATAVQLQKKPTVASAKNASESGSLDPLPTKYGKPVPLGPSGEFTDPFGEFADPYGLAQQAVKSEYTSRDVAKRNTAAAAAAKAKATPKTRVVTSNAATLRRRRSRPG